MMKVWRAGIVGSSSLLGKELAEELGSSAPGVTDLVLLDEDVEAGQMASTGDEATFIQRIEAGSFDGMAVCLFAGRGEEVRRHWQTAVRAGTAVVDLTASLTEADGAKLVNPWMSNNAARGRHTAVVPIHPVAAMLALVGSRCVGLGLKQIAATLLEPASERGAAGVDEMHQQTVSLLSFQSPPKVEFDAQAAFNLLPALGPGARTAMEATARMIRSDYSNGSAGPLPGLALQIIHAPVFHGFGASVVLDFAVAVSGVEVAGALAGSPIRIVAASEDVPSTVSAVGEKEFLLKVTEDGGRVWLWMAADNLRMRAVAGAACALAAAGAGPPGAVH